MIRHFQMLSHYNHWASQRIYGAAAVLSNDEYRRDKGAFFGSLHATLNHILAADRIWLRRFTGSGDAPTSLDAIIYEDFATLQDARQKEDRRIIEWLAGLHEDKLWQDFTYTPVSNPLPITHLLAPALTHFFNHQTHHRGQAHTILTSLGKPSVVLDLITFMRTEGVQWMSLEH